MTPAAEVCSEDSHKGRRPTMTTRRQGFIIVVAALAVCCAGPAFANIQAFTIDGDATLAPGGLEVTVTGTLQCSLGESASIGVAVAQDRGQQTATASGSTQLTCDGSLQSWSIHAITNSGLKTGPAGPRARAPTLFWPPPLGLTAPPTPPPPPRLRLGSRPLARSPATRTAGRH